MPLLNRPPVSMLGSGVATLDSQSRLNTAQMPALTGDVTTSAGTVATTVGKIQGKTVSSATPTAGQVLQYDGTNIVWGTAPSGGASGGGGLVYFFNNSVAADLPTTGLPSIPVKIGRAHV